VTKYNNISFDYVVLGDTQSRFNPFHFFKTINVTIARSSEHGKHEVCLKNIVGVILMQK